MSEQDQVLDSINSNEEQELDINLEDDSDDVETLKAQVAEKDTFARQAIARAKKAEAELKELKGKPEASQKLNNPVSQDTIEETVLKAQGESQEMIDQLKKIAQVTGKTLLEARQDPYFQAIKKASEEEVKSSQAKLGASKGSGSKKAEKSFNTPGLTAEEHKALWKEKMGR